MPESRHPTVVAIGADLVLARGRVRLPRAAFARWQLELETLQATEREAVASDLVALALELGRVFSRAAEHAINQIAKLAASAACGRDGTVDPQPILRRAALALGMNIGSSYLTPTVERRQRIDIGAAELAAGS